ncbi:MAG: substrate-binding domain-containing protein [Myxococcales bacterium]|nr:substrate-binding domain-containing protein [Myxococcales bacterium]
MRPARLLRNGLVVATGLLVAACSAGESASVGREPGGTCLTDQTPGVDLIVAGSGSVLPLAQRVNDHMAAVSPGIAVWMPESLGSTGGIAALRDGAIDIALVSRSLSVDEQSGLLVRPIAQAASTFFVNRDGVTELRRADLIAIYRGELREWPDGTPIVPMLRESGDSGERTLSVHWPEVYDELQQARESRLWPIQSTDQDMAAALRDTPGAIGLLDVGLSAGLGLQMPMIDGVRPDEATLMAGDWPLMRPLSALFRAEPTEAVQAWLRSAEVALQPLPSGWVGYEPAGLP